MYDLHAHILPGIDDGPDGWDSALAMLKMAVDDGINGIVATPHVNPGLYDNGREAVLGLVEALKARAGELPIEVYPGSELAVSAETLPGIRDGRYCTVNFGKYALVELPGNFRPQGIYDFIFSLTAAGFVPVVAHPERNPQIVSDMAILYEIVRMGALGQVTAGSLTGVFGTDSKRAAHEMIKRRLVHVIASDAHSDKQRQPVLSAAVKEAGKTFGGRVVAEMVGSVPAKIIKNETFEVADPVYKKSSFSIF